MKKLSILTLLFFAVQGFAQTPELIFHSGFEPNVLDTTNGVTSDIFGIDNSVSPPNDWIFDLEGHPNIGDFSIQYQGGDDTMRFAKIIQDPNNPTNNVLHYWLKYPNVGGTKGRIQANLYGNTNLTEISQKVKLYLPSDWNIIKNSGGQVGWLTVMEFWNNVPTQDTIHPFRITLGIFKLDANSTELNFSIEAQMMPTSPPWPIVWEENDTTFSVPVDQWMTIEYYFKEGNASTGRFVMAVTPDGGQREVIFDVTNFTHHPNDPSPDGLARFNPMKLYTSNTVIDYVRNNGGVLQVYWDDFEINKDTNIVLGIAENETISAFKLFPNPITEDAVLMFKNPKNENHTFTLFDSQGRIVRSITGIKSEQVKIKKENLITGLYLFRLSNSKTSVTGKLMIE
jgi:Secretion system C-terminal sorting domain